MTYKKIAIVQNDIKQLAVDAIRNIQNWSDANGFSTHIVTAQYMDDYIAGKATPVMELNAIKNCDFCISLGGDGTLMRVAKVFSQLMKPILAINLGNLGFHTQADFDDIEMALDKIKTNDFITKSYLMLETNLDNSSRQIAINDIVIAKEMMGHMIHLGIEIDGRFVTKVSADALVISTPIGSTAYNYAAGGAIIAPGVEAISIVGVCPHRRGISPIIVSPHSHIKIYPFKKEVNEHIHIIIDGQNLCRLNEDNVLNIASSSMYLKLIEFQNDYYVRLRTKLAWGRE